MDYQFTTIERRGGIAVVRFDRKEKLNAFNQDLIVEMTAVARWFHDDLDIHAVVLTGAPKAFSAGADDFVTKPFEVQEVDARVHALLRKREALVNMEHAVRDLTSTNERLEQLLMVDEKTGLYNFREFQRRLKAEWARAEVQRLDEIRLHVLELRCETLIELGRPERALEAERLTGITTVLMACEPIMIRTGCPPKTGTTKASSAAAPTATRTGRESILRGTFW